MASAANSLPEDQPRREQLSLLPKDMLQALASLGSSGSSDPGSLETQPEPEAVKEPPDNVRRFSSAGDFKGTNSPFETQPDPPPVSAELVDEILAELQRTDALGLELAAAAGGQPKGKDCFKAGIGTKWGLQRWHEIKDLEPAALTINQWARATELAEFRTNGTVPKVQRAEQEASPDDTELCPASAVPTAQGLSEEQLAYLSERGIPAETAQELYRRENNDLLIPYYGPTGDAYVIRSKEPKHDGKPYIVRRPFPKQTPKFLTPAAGGNRPYFSRLMPDGALERMDWPVVFVEGPIKCDALWCQIPEGFVFVALSGTWNWQDKRGADGIWRRENEETRVLPELRDIPMAGRVVTTLFDSDISDNNNVYRAAKMLRAWAQQRGARPHEVLLPNEPDGSKNGPDDYLERHGAEALVQLLQSAEPTGWPLSGPMLTPEGELRNDYSPSEQKRLIKELGQIQDITVRDTTIRSLASRLRWKFSEIIAAIEDTAEGDSMDDNFFIGADQFEDSGNIDSRWIVPNLLPRGEVIVLTALSGLGKSLLVYELLYAVATGGEFLGFPVQKGKVLILQLEEGKSSWTTRLKAKGFTALGNPGPGQPWALNTSFDLAKPRHVEILKGIIKQVDVVMIDSARAVGRSFDIDENHADFGKRIIRPLARLFNGSDASGIIIHHNAKGTGKAAGTEDIIAAVWGVFNLKAAPGASKGEEGAPNEFHLISDKGRDTDAIKWHLRRERTDGVDESGNGWQYELLAELQYMAPDLTLRDRVFVVLKGAPAPLNLRTIAQELGLPDDSDGKVNSSLRSAAARDPGIRRWRIEQKGPHGEALYQLPEGFWGYEGEKPVLQGTERHPPVKTDNPATRQCSSAFSGLYQIAKRTKSNPESLEESSSTPDQAEKSRKPPVSLETQSTTAGLRVSPKMGGGVCVPPKQGGKKPRKPRAVKEAPVKEPLATEATIGTPLPSDPLVNPGSTDPLVIDLETASVKEQWSHPEFVRLVGSEHGNNISPDQLLEHQGALVGHNLLNFDACVLAQHHGLDFFALGDAGRLIDTEVLETLIQVNRDDMGMEQYLKSLGLQSCTERRGLPGKSDWLVPNAEAYGKELGLTGNAARDAGFALVPRNHPEFNSYLRTDIEQTRAVFESQCPGGQLNPYQLRLMRACSRLVYGIRFIGFRIDRPLVEERVAEKNRQVALGVAELQSIGVPSEGKDPVSTNVGKAAIDKAFMDLGVKLPRTKKSNSPQITKDGMAALAEKYASNPEIHRLASTLAALKGQRSTMQNVLDNAVGDRVHPSVFPGQATGRYSITNPGLTILGKDGEERLRDRDPFIPDADDHSLIAGDLSKADARGVAVNSQAHTYLDWFEQGLDINLMLSERFGVSKRLAKCLGHGVRYHQQPNGMHSQYGIPLEECENFLREHKQLHPEVHRWHDVIVPHAENGHGLWNGYGRQLFTGFRSSKAEFRPGESRAFTQAPALICQSLTMEWMITGILNLRPEVAKCIRCFLHDEIVLSVPDRHRDLYMENLVESFNFRFTPPADQMMIRVKGAIRPVDVVAEWTAPGKRWSDLYRGED
jgi:hypothetical protein